MANDSAPVNLNSKYFSYSADELKNLARETVKSALKQGADEATVNISEGIGLAVNVRAGAAEQSEYSHSKGLSISLAINKKNGSASSSDLTPAAISKAIRAALDFAKYTSSDEFSGLPEKKLLATKFQDLDLFHPWDLSMAQATEICTEYEALAIKQDKRIKQIEGFQLSSSIGQSVLANSLDFVTDEKSSHHNISCAVIASDEQGMQRDYWYTDSRLAIPTVQFKSTALKAVSRTLCRLSPRKFATGKFPVIFDESIAASLFRTLVQAVSGGNLYRKSSFLLDSIGKVVLPKQINIFEDPFIKQAIASKNCDAEGVAVNSRKWVDSGVLQGYFLSCYSGRKLKMPSTGNAGGAHNLEVLDNKFCGSQTDLIKSISNGILITETLGHGINMVTGDYSVGACGFAIQNGELQYPVEEITIAGNLNEMFLGIEGISSDGIYRGGIKCGSVLINSLTIAGL